MLLGWRCVLHALHLLCGLALTQSAARGPRIHLRNGVLDTSDSSARWSAPATSRRRLLAAAAGSHHPQAAEQEHPRLGTQDARWGPLRGRGSGQFLVAAAAVGGGEGDDQGPAAADVFQELEATVAPHGGALSHYVPDSSLLLLGDEAVAAAAAAVPGIAWVGEFQPEHKVAPEWAAVLERVAGAAAQRAQQAAAAQQPQQGEEQLGPGAVLDRFGDGNSSSNSSSYSSMSGGSSGDGAWQGWTFSSADGILGLAGGGERATIDVTFPSPLRKRRPPGGTAAAAAGEWGSAGREKEQQAHQPAHAAAQEWAGELQARLGAGPGDVRVEGPDHLAVAVPLERLPAALALLAAQPAVQAALALLVAQPAVHWLAPRTPARLHNWQATAICQSATAAPVAPVALSQDQGTHPLWAAGLTGKGEVAGGGDSGVDYENCFFKDPAVPWSSGLRTDVATGVTSFESTTHRKIRLYRQVGSAAVADSVGHGTHVMGSLLGQPFDESAVMKMDYRGAAPDAKLAFFNLGGTNNDGIYTPQDLASSYFPFTYGVGARVHSDSWGSAALSYDYLASQVDLFTWEHQDFTTVFAAGNEGIASAPTTKNGGLTTVTSPATAKNCITAGATNTAFQDVGGARSGRYTVHQMSVLQQVASGNDEIEKFRVMQASFGPSIANVYGAPLPLSAAAPANGCGNLTNAAAVRGTVVLMQRGSCFFSQKALNAQQAGARVMLVYDDQIADYFVAASDSAAGDITIPSGAVPRRVGQLLVSAATAGGKLSVAFAAAAPLANSFDSLADFSSKGPTQDGRVKPDVLAPGTVQSAYSPPGGDACSLRYMEGTSMATPHIAGAAVLARGYFTGGFYPSGRANSSAGFAPSGSLIKAVLVGGALGLDGFESDTGLPLAPPPSFRQGFGRLDLSRSLPLQGSGPGWSLQLVNLANLTTGERHSYCLHATGGPLTITLVWHDYPAALSAGKALVNDLDLSVRAAGLNGLPLLGNGGASGGVMEADRLNNVEQVALSYLPAGDVAIDVTGHQVFSPQGPQPYSLVALGKFSGVLASPANPAAGAAPSPAPVCRIVVVTITAGPSGLTNQTDISYSFQSATGSSGGITFECALTSLAPMSGSDNSSANYQDCTSPQRYTQPGGSPLADGTYRFSVRAKGEQVADSRTFTKDTQPPRTTFNSTLPADGPATRVFFSWATQDANPVTSVCQLSVGAAPPGVAQGPIRQLAPNAPDLPGPLQLGQWAPCQPPLTFYGLLPGNWSFAVRTTDAAGNQAPQDLVANWTVAFAPGQPYVRLAQGPLGVTSNKTANFLLTALQADSTGAVTQVPNPVFECQLDETGNSTLPIGLSPTPMSATASQLIGRWGPCKAAPAFPPLRDGGYIFAARLANSSSSSSSGNSSDADPQTWAMTDFVVDTVPPTVQIVSAPGNYSASASVKVQFAASKPATTFRCQLAGPDNATDAPSSGGGGPPGACASPAQWSGLRDGPYTVTINGTDRVGNRAPPATTAFLVDTMPPSFEHITFPTATRADNITLAFNVSDAGSGIANVTCRMRAQRLATADSAAASPSAASPSPNATSPSPNATSPSATDAWRDCASPTAFGPLGEGKWGLTLRAMDRAGNVRETEESAVYVDRQPQNASIEAGPDKSRPTPPRAIFSFAGQADSSSWRAPVASSSCILQNADAKQGNGSTGPLGAPGGDINVQLRSVSSATPGAWFNCTSPVTLNDLKTGNYSFQVRLTDAAGNVGPPSAPYRFAVDSSLAVPGDEGPSLASQVAAWFQGWHLYAVIAAAAVLAIASFACCYCCCSRRRPRQGAPAGAYANMLDQGAGGGVYDPALAFALQQSAREQEQREQERRRQGAAQAAAEEQRMRRAIEASLEEERVREAIARSLSPSRRGEGRSRASPSGSAAPRGLPEASAASPGRGQAHRPGSPYEDEDAQMRAAIQASLREEEWRRASERGGGEEGRPSAPPGVQLDPSSVIPRRPTARR